ncbi:hypothetical protein [Brevundimonas sp.]|uniref:hypothetical protein n=1 Tax=Brevundimonas TaxID=41275 RepID=UPI00289C4D02|nr:hypothetical protein [Brevundimonas sp.]
MARRRDPFMLARESLRSRAEQGVYVPGSPVVIMDEARRLNLSTTPVREALVWLCGYGLIERSPTGGFLAPRLDRAIIRDRYAFRLQCVVQSLTGAVDGGSSDQALRGTHDAGPDLPGHMLQAVKRTGNAALVDAYQRVCSQLIQLQAAEKRLFGDIVDEAGRIVLQFDQPRIAADVSLVEALAAYHRRRIEAAPLLMLEVEAGRREAGDGE